MLFDAARLNGTFAGRGLSGSFAGARSTVGNVPLAMSDMAGLDVGWRIRKGRGVRSEVADRICVLDAGVVTEIGTHEQLLRQNGLYHRLVMLQQLGELRE